MLLLKTLENVTCLSFSSGQINIIFALEKHSQSKPIEQLLNLNKLILQNIDNIYVDNIDEL